MTKKDYSLLYRDYINLFNELFTLNEETDLYDLAQRVKDILLIKYKVNPPYRFTSFIESLEMYNYKARDLYFILSCLIDDKEPVYQCRILDELQTIILYDAIENFRDYIFRRGLPDKIYYYSFGNLTPLEASCIFGSVNIFYFLLNNSNLSYDELITTKCLKNAIMGRNIDIINECLRYVDFDKECIETIIQAHFHDLFEFVISRARLNFKFNPNDYIFSIFHFLNLNAVFLLHKYGYDIFPWCAKFPQTIEIINDTNFKDFHIDILLYASQSNDLEFFKYIFYNYPHHPKSISETLNNAFEKNIWDVVDFLISEDIDLNAPDFKGHLPIVAAAASSKKNYVIKLVENGANPNLHNKDFWENVTTYLDYHKDADILKRLYELGLTIVTYPFDF